MAFGLRFTSLTRPQLMTLLELEPVRRGDGARIVCTANLDHIVQLQKSPALRQAYDAAWCVTADGMPVYAYARLKRENVPARVAGSDIVRDLVASFRPEGKRFFFVTSCEETTRGLCRMLEDRGFAADDMVFVVPPFGFERDDAWSTTLARRVREHGTTHLFFGVGAPKSEIWTHQHRRALGDCYVLNAGAALDYACGVRRRAPAWMQHSGLEWLWRFGAEPKRLFKRYFIDSWGFLSAIWLDLSASGPTTVG